MRHSNSAKANKKADSQLPTMLSRHYRLNGSLETTLCTILKLVSLDPLGLYDCKTYIKQNA